MLARRRSQVEDRRPGTSVWETVQSIVGPWTGRWTGRWLVACHVWSRLGRSEVNGRSRRDGGAEISSHGASKNEVPPLFCDPVRFAQRRSGQCSKPPIFLFFHLGEVGSYVVSSHFFEGTALVTWNLEWGRAERALFFGAHAFCRCIFFTLAATFGPTPQANLLLFHRN